MSAAELSKKLCCLLWIFLVNVSKSGVFFHCEVPLTFPRDLSKTPIAVESDILRFFTEHCSWEAHCKKKEVFHSGFF